MHRWNLRKKVLCGHSLHFVHLHCYFPHVTNPTLHILKRRSCSQMTSYKLSSTTTIQKLLDVSLCQSYDMGLSSVLRPKFIRFKLFYQPMPSEVIAFFLNACYWHEGYVLCMISLGKSNPWPCWEPQLLGHWQLLFIWRSNVQFYLPPLCLV